MNRAATIKVAASHLPLRKSATTVARHGFPAWIDVDEGGVAFAARKTVRPRVRDGLVLRMIGRGQKASVPRRTAHGTGAR